LSKPSDKFQVEPILPEQYDKAMTHQRKLKLEYVSSLLLFGIKTYSTLPLQNSKKYRFMHYFYDLH
jgi:hypothetical protein